jgi:hypothetical protein
LVVVAHREFLIHFNSANRIYRHSNSKSKVCIYFLPRTGQKKLTDQSVILIRRVPLFIQRVAKREML